MIDHAEAQTSMLLYHNRYPEAWQLAPLWGGTKGDFFKRSFVLGLIGELPEDVGGDG